MGEVFVKGADIFLFSPIEDNALINLIHEVLEQKEAWEDPPRLAILVAGAMINSPWGDTGCSMCTESSDPMLIIDLDYEHHRIALERYPGTDETKHTLRQSRFFTYEDFIAADPKSLYY